MEKKKICVKSFVATVASSDVILRQSCIVVLFLALVLMNGFDDLFVCP